MDDLHSRRRARWDDYQSETPDVLPDVQKDMGSTRLHDGGLLNDPTTEAHFNEYLPVFQQIGSA